MQISVTMDGEVVIEDDFAQHVQGAFEEYLGKTSPELVHVAVSCRARNFHRQDVENIFSRLCTTEEALALSFILMDVQSLKASRSILSLQACFEKKEEVCAQQKSKLYENEQLVSKLQEQLSDSESTVQKLSSELKDSKQAMLHLRAG